MSRRRVPFISLGVIAILAVTAGAQAVADSSDPFSPPPKGTLTVAPAPPGADYKSNPSEPEKVQTLDGPISLDALQKAVDPGDDPTILVCVTKEGGGMIQFVTQAEDNAKPDPAAKATTVIKAEFINDKGEC